MSSHMKGSLFLGYVKQLVWNGQGTIPRAVRNRGNNWGEPHWGTGAQYIHICSAINAAARAYNNPHCATVVENKVTADLNGAAHFEAWFDLHHPHFKFSTAPLQQRQEYRLAYLDHLIEHFKGFE